MLRGQAPPSNRRPGIISMLGSLMPPKANLSSKGWKYHFYRRDRAAREGRHLPTLHELHCGMAFFNESLAHDVQEWSERTIPSLADKGQPLARNPVQTALGGLSVSTSLKDLKFVCAELKKYETTSEKTAEVQCAIRRLTFYRAVSGDVTALPLLCEDLVTMIRKLTSELMDS
jgi:hypothetical protein